MFAKLKMCGIALIALFGFMVGGCATTTSGPTDPILSQFIPKTLDDNAMILTDYATTDCNAGAAKEYNINMVICANPGAVVSQIPGTLFVTPAQITAVITAKCMISGYSSSLPITLQPGPESVCLNPPAPVPAPAPVSGATDQHSYRTHKHKK